MDTSICGGMYSSSQLAHITTRPETDGKCSCIYGPYTFVWCEHTRKVHSASGYGSCALICGTGRELYFGMCDSYVGQSTCLQLLALLVTKSYFLLPPKLPNCFLLNLCQLIKPDNYGGNCQYSLSKRPFHRHNKGKMKH